MHSTECGVITLPADALHCLLSRPAAGMHPQRARIYGSWCFADLCGLVGGCVSHAFTGVCLPYVSAKSAVCMPWACMGKSCASLYSQQIDAHATAIAIHVVNPQMQPCLYSLLWLCNRMTCSGLRVPDPGPARAQGDLHGGLQGGAAHPLAGGGVRDQQAARAGRPQDARAQEGAPACCCTSPCFLQPSALCMLP